MAPHWLDRVFAGKHGLAKAELARPRDGAGDEPESCLKLKFSVP